MNIEMAYMLGMILGNGEIQQNNTHTTVTIDIPYKNLRTDDMKDVKIYVKASIVDIRSIIEPLIGHALAVTQTPNATKLSFSKPNEEYVIREMLRLIGGGRHHSTMKMNPELFSLTVDQKKALLRGIADVTGYIRRSNYAYKKYAHRVYIEIPQNWHMVIDIANMLKDIDIPIQTINFGHPNFRDSNLEKYNEGKISYWKKEHQIKIYANEFLPIGFNVKHKQEALDIYADELLKHMTHDKTHKFYWETKKYSNKTKPVHPAEKDASLPDEIRERHFDSWTDLARLLGYGE